MSGNYETYLRALDDRYRDALPEVTLVGELDLPTEKASIAARILLLRAHQLPAADVKRYLARYRYAVLATMVCFTQHLYAGGGFWPRFDEWLRSHGFPTATTQQIQTAIREVTIDTLRDLDMPTVGDGYEFVDSAAMHAGIPTYCLDDWFNLTARGRRRVGDDPEEITHWAAANRDRAVMNDIDQPIKRMLVYGPEFAADLFDRATELIDYLVLEHRTSDLEAMANADTLEGPALDKTLQIGLGEQWLRMAALNLTKVDSESHGQTKGSRAPARPALRLDAVEGRVQLILPAISDIQDPFDWHVTMGSRTTTHPVKLDTTGSTIASRPQTVTIDTPCPSVTVAALGTSRTVHVLAPERPVLAFSATGTHRPTVNGVLAAGRSWLLVHREANSTVGDMPLPIVAEDDSPFGWHDWRLLLVDLEPHTTLRVSLGDDKTFTLRVQGRTTPELILPEAVEGARSFGQAVYAAMPSISLPPSPHGWRITVRRRGQSELAADTTVPGGQTLDLASLGCGDVGVFEIQARGPLGRSLKEQVAVVRNLAFLCNPPVRRLQRDGQLAPCHVRSMAAVGVDVDPAGAHLAAEDSFVQFLYSDGSSHVSVRFYPPATMVALHSPAGGRRWGPRPVRVDSGSVSDAVLLIRSPGVAADQISAVAGRDVVQQLPVVSGPHEALVRLGALSDTLAEHPSLLLCLPDGQPVATVAPIPRWSGVAVSPDATHLALQDFSGDGSSLEAWAWWSEAPWREPVPLAVQPDGHIDLPSDMQGAGPLSVHLREVDPWSIPGPPSTDAKRALVEAQGHPTFTATEAAVLAPPEDGTAIDWGPEEVRLATDLFLGGRRARKALDQATERRVAEHIRRYAHDAVLGLADRDVSMRAVVPALVEMGLLDHAERGQSAVQLWETNPLLGALFGATPLLIDAAPDTVESAVAEFGDSYRAALALGKDPSAGVGRFAENTITFETMPSAQQDVVLRTIGVVPGPLLDDGMRISRTMDVVRTHRDGAKITGNLRILAEQLRHGLASAKLHTLADDVHAAYPGANNRPHHWVLPFTRGLLLTARARAYTLTDGDLDPLMPLFLFLSNRFPELVHAEWVRAEALVAHHVVGATTILDKD